MRLKLFTYLTLFIPLTALAQIGSVPGTLNQIQPDPEQKKFENEVQDLRDTVEALDEPSAPKPSSELREPKRKLPAGGRKKSRI